MQTSCCRRGSGALIILMLMGFLVAAALSGAVLSASGKGAAVAPAALQPFLPPETQELAYVEVGPPMAHPGTWVAAWSFRDFRGNDMVIHSRILVVGPERAGGQAKLLWQSKEEDLYAPKVTLECRLTYEGSPLVLVSRQKGAAWQFIQVIGFAHQQPRSLETLESERLELTAVTPGTGPQLLSYRRWYSTPLPDILEWNGKKFVKAWQKYPQYYKGLLEKKSFLREGDLKSLEVAWLTARAGKRAEAIKLLEERRAAGGKQDAPSLKPVERDGKWGFTDPAGKIVIPPQFDYAGGFSEALAPVLTGSGWGYIDESGKMVIPPQFAEVDLFAEGLAAVKTGGKWGFIDQTGKMVIPPQDMIQPYSAPLRFTEGLVPVTIGHRYGYMDKTGKVVIPPQFVVTAEGGAPAEFSRGVAQVEIPPTWGYIDRNGKIVIPYQFQEGRPFRVGLAPVAVKGKWGFIDKSAKMVIAPQYDEVEPFSQGLAAVRLGDKYGFIDMTGKLAVPPQFDQTERFSEGLARVRDNKEQKWGFIDRTGKLAIPYSFTHAGNFAEERAWVELDGHGGFIDPAGKVSFTVNKPVYFTSPRFVGGLAPAYSKGKWGYVDKAGKFVIQPRFDFAKDFSGPTAVVRLGKRYGLVDRSGKMVAEMKPPASLSESADGLTQFTPDLQGNRWGFVDSSGKMVIAPRYVVPPVEGGMPPQFSQGLAAVYVKGKYGFIDRQGKLVIAATFDEASSYAEGLAPVATGYRLVAIDKTGKVIKEFPPSEVSGGKSEPSE